VYGVSAAYHDIRSWNVRDGRPLDPEDIRVARKVCLLGQTVADALFPDGDAVGQTVRIRNVPVEIVGVLERKGQTAEGADQDDVVLAPYTTVQKRLRGRQFIGTLLASATSQSEVALAMQEITGALRDAHKLSPKQPDDFTVRDQAQLAATAKETTQVMTTLLFAVASISLLVGGIGIMNIMLVSVTERTREIGLRRALGARQGDVLAQFLVEAVVLSALGGALGALVGVLSAAILAQATGWATHVTPSSLLIALAFSAAVGVFFGWYPARRAARLDPIEALRYQ
jgi:putative ABC transport system permease protein